LAEILQSDTPQVALRRNVPLDLDQVIQLYRDSTLGERRPVDNRETMEAMMRHADLVVTAWIGDRLVGIARTLTDFAYVAYLADLAVDKTHQRAGIGRLLVEATRDALEPGCFITLLSAPAANGYYPKIGFEPHPRAWILPAKGTPPR